MKNNEKNYKSLIHFSSKVMFINIGISEIFMESGENYFFSIIFGSIIGALLMILLNKFNNKKENKIKNILLFILIYTLMIICLSILLTFIKDLYLTDMDKTIIMIPVLILIIYMNTKDINVHLKVSNILLLITLGLFILSYTLLMPDIKPLNYLPLFNIKTSKLLLSSFKFAIYTTVPSIILCKIDSNIKTKSLIKSYIISNITLLMIFFVTIGVMGIDLVNIFKYPHYVALKRINILHFLENMENFLSFAWINILLIYISICSKILSMSFNTKNSKIIYPLFLITTLIILSKWLFDNIKFSLFLNNYLWIILLIILMIFIIINIIKKEDKSS